MGKEKIVYGEKDKAWCPVCFDKLNCIEIYDGFGLIKRHKYKCFRCDKNFELKETSQKETNEK